MLRDVTHNVLDRIILSTKNGSQMAVEVRAAFDAFELRLDELSNTTNTTNTTYGALRDSINALGHQLLVTLSGGAFNATEDDVVDTIIATEGDFSRPVVTEGWIEIMDAFLEDMNLTSEVNSTRVLASVLGVADAVAQEIDPDFNEVPTSTLALVVVRLNETLYEVS